MEGESQGMREPHLDERERGRSEREQEEERVDSTVKADSKEEREGKLKEPP